MYPCIIHRRKSVNIWTTATTNGGGGCTHYNVITRYHGPRVCTYLPNYTHTAHVLYAIFDVGVYKSRRRVNDIFPFCFDWCLSNNNLFGDAAIGPSECAENRWILFLWFFFFTEAFTEKLFVAEFSLYRPLRFSVMLRLPRSYKFVLIRTVYAG